MHEALRSLERAYLPAHALVLELEQRGQDDHTARVSRAMGRLLSVLVHCMQANRILEIGTGYGYATLWMALALPPAGRIWTFDPNIERTQVAREYFDRSGASDQIEIINQPALEVLPIFPQRNMDIVFVDAPHVDYESYLEYCIPLLKLSGLLVVNGLLTARDTERFIGRFLERSDLDATVIPLDAGVGIGARKR